MTMERSLLPLPGKKKSSPLGKNLVNSSVDKSKSLKNSLKSMEMSKKKVSPLELNKSIPPSSARDGKNKLKESTPGLSIGSKTKSQGPIGPDVSNSNCKRISSTTYVDALAREQYEPSRLIADDQGSNLGFIFPRGHGALSCPTKAYRGQETSTTRQSSLRSFSKHLPQFAKDVLSSKGCTSKVQPTYQKLDKFKFGDDVLVEDLDNNEEGESSPIYHELDPIGIQCSKHTYQSIGEIQEELSKMGSTSSIPEPRSEPPVHFPGPNIPCQNAASSPVAHAKVKSSPKSFFSKMWQPKKSQKSSQKECKFINSMPLLLPKESPDCLPDEAQRSPSLITFLGATRSQMGSISQPGSANLEKSGYASSPHACRVFTFEDIEINDSQFPQHVYDINRLDVRVSPLPLTKEFKKAGVAKQRVSPLALDSPKSETCSNIGCYATLVFPESSFSNASSLSKKGSKLMKCFEPHSKTLHSALAPPRLLPNQNKMLAYGRSSLVKEPYAYGDRKINRNLKLHPTNTSEVFMNESMEQKSQNTSGSIESLLSQDTLRSDSPVFLQSPLPRSPYSSPSCGVRMAELRANSRRSDSKSPSPEPPHGTCPTFPYHLKDVPHFASRLDGAATQSAHLMKSPPRVVCKSPNRYMHTILEEEHSVEQVLCIQSIEEVSTSASSSDLPEIALEERAYSEQVQEIVEDKLKAAVSIPDMKGLRSASLSSDLASLPSDFFSSEDSINCPTTDSELSFKTSENEAGFLRRDQYYIKVPNKTLSTNFRNPHGNLISDTLTNPTKTLRDQSRLPETNKLNKVGGEKAVKSSKLRPPKSSSSCTPPHIDNPVDKTQNTFQAGASKSPPFDSSQSNGSINSPSKTQFGGAEGRRSYLIGPTSGLKQKSLKYTKPLVSGIGPSSSSSTTATQRQHPDLVAVEIKAPTSIQVSTTNGQGSSRFLRAPKTSKSHFGFVKDQTLANNSPVNSRNCQTIPAPSRGAAPGFESFPKCETTIIHHQGPRHRTPQTSTSAAICDLNSSLSSSPTSSSSSMFSTVESENEGLLLSLRKDLRMTKESSSQSLDSRTTSSLTSNSGSETSKGSEKSRLLAPRTDVSRCFERYSKILGSAQDSNPRSTTSTTKQLKNSQSPTVSTDC